MDFALMASEIGFDMEDFLELAEMLVETSLSDLRHFEEAMEAEDLTKAAMAAHSIKGASANLGFAELATTAKTLESFAKIGNLSEIDTHLTLIKQQIQDIGDALNQNQ